MWFLYDVVSLSYWIEKTKKKTYVKFYILVFYWFFAQTNGAPLSYTFGECWDFETLTNSMLINTTFDWYVSNHVGMAVTTRYSAK